MLSAESLPTLQGAENVSLIAVMGVTGSGKSTFIKHVTGSDKVIVGSDLTSCTKKPVLHPFNHAGTTVILIDTPGFDDTYLSDGDVLQEVAKCLEFTYKCNLKLTGIIYMHRIMDPRMTHGGMRNLAIFRKLCGPEPMTNVLLATSFWGKVTMSEGCARENELRTNPDFWAEMIEQGAQMIRFENTKASGLDLIDRLVDKGKTALRIQTEMCENNIPLAHTEAGEQVNGDLAEMAKKHAAAMKQLQREMQEAVKAADTRMEATLKRELTKSEWKLTQLQAQQEALRDDHRNETRLLEQEFDRRFRRAEAAKKEEVTDTRPAKKPSTATKPTTPAQQQQRDEAKRKREKKAKIVKYVKIAGAVGSTAIGIASCVVNPMGSVSAVSSFVQLLNLIFSGKDAPSAADGDEADGEVDGTGDGGLNCDAGYGGDFDEVYVDS